MLVCRLLVEKLGRAGCLLVWREPVLVRRYLLWWLLVNCGGVVEDLMGGHQRETLLRVGRSVWVLGVSLLDRGVGSTTYRRVLRERVSWSGNLRVLGGLLLQEHGRYGGCGGHFGGRMRCVCGRGRVLWVV